MKTLVRHWGPGCYDLAHPNERSEGWKLTFDPADPEHTTITFDYMEADAPDIPNWRTMRMRVDDLIEELAYYPSKEYLYSSSYNHIGQKKHDERIEIAQELAEKNLHDDLIAYRERLQERLDTISKELQDLDQEIADLMDLK